MAYMIAMGECYACHCIFEFNAELVPSLNVDGIREPICKKCMDWANTIRKQSGREPVRVMPGAYEPEEC